jgi:hypothetical protein
MPGSLSTPSLFAVWSCHPGGRSPALFLADFRIADHPITIGACGPEWLYERPR